MSPSATPSAPARQWALILYWIGLFTATHWPDVEAITPDSGWPIPHFTEIMHGILYAGWVAMWWWVIAARHGRVSRSAQSWLLVGGMAFAAFDELSQAIVDRTPSLIDYLIDVLGMLAATTILSFWQNHRPARHRPSHLRGT